MKQGHGNWVVGDRFWDREIELEQVIDYLDEGAHLLLVAQRRMGKTSLMKETARRLENRYICLFIDLQKAMSSADAIVELSLATHPHKSLWNKSSELFSNILDKMKDAIDSVEFKDLGIKLRAGLTEGNWIAKGDQLLSILAGSEKPVVLFLDEVPILVNRILKDEDGNVAADGKKLADSFMSWLRDNSIRHQGKLRIVLSGSIGLGPILNQAGLSATLNTFRPFDLKPWEEETSIGCLNALAEEYGVLLHEDAAQIIVRKLGCGIPHHVQMFFNYIYDKCKRRGRMDFFPDEVEEVYHSEMLSVRGHAELTHYEERLKLVLGKERFSLAIEMLTESAVAGKLNAEALEALRANYQFKDMTAAQVQREILQVLEHDGYLMGGTEGYVFVSKLVRDWWKRRYEAFYTPILDGRI
jgi:uncharacterized protein